MKTKDWVGNNKAIFSTLGASNHSEYERAEDDYYATDPITIDYLLKYENFNKNIWECACGDGALSKRLEEHGYNVLSTDIAYRGYGKPDVDFLKQTEQFDGDIITNPPYKNGIEFVNKAIELSSGKVAMFLKIQFLESVKRYANLYSKNPPKSVYVFVKRVNCYHNGIPKDFSSAVCYAWYVWEKGFTGETTVKWIDNRS